MEEVSNTTNMTFTFNGDNQTNHSSSPSSSTSSETYLINLITWTTWQRALILLLTLSFAILLKDQLPKRILAIFVTNFTNKKRNLYCMWSRWIQTDSVGDNTKVKTHATSTKGDAATTPTSVNYHFTRQCNYKCGFCFHTAKTSYVLPLEEAKKGLRLLAEAGMEKINFSGGEPFLPERGRFVGEMVRFCKEELNVPSVTIVSNGSLIKEKWFREYGTYLDILAISCDSFNPETNSLIGRQQGRKNHLDSLHKVKEWCAQYKVAFKINSVINTYNKDEDLSQEIMALNPCRWKVFQCLVIDGENAGPDALRNAEQYVISDEEFQEFLDRHKHVPCLVPESNDAMRFSYLILDEYMRFLDGGTKKPSASILDVGVQNAIDFSNFDEKMFLKRGGRYKWSKKDMELEW